MVLCLYCAPMEPLGLVGFLKNLFLLRGKVSVTAHIIKGVARPKHSHLPFHLSPRHQWGGGHSGNKNVGPPATHPTKVAEALQDLVVEEAGLGWVCQGLVQEVVDEVDSWLHGQHHAWLQVPCCAQTPQARLINALYTLERETEPN